MNPTIPPCRYPMNEMHTKFCGASGLYHDVDGPRCGAHWDPQQVHWYVNGLRYGWDEQHRDPTLDL